VAIGIHLVGQAAKRGPLRRVPAADRFVEEIAGWIHDNAADAVRSTRIGRPALGSAAVLVDLHPAGEPAQIVLDDDGVVTVEAPTAVVGPGYHTYVCRLLQRLAEELSIEWAPTAPNGGAVDATGYFSTGDRSDAERGLLIWLRDVLVQARELRRRRGLGVQICRVAGDRFDVEGAVASCLGPRDDEWLGRAIAEPRVAIDVWPWFTDATDARYLLNRALCLMWTEVRWRTPAADGEPELFDEVLRLLHRAYPLDPSLPYPWHEWGEMLRLMPFAEPLAARIAERAARPLDRAPIGYRRKPVTVVHAGWSLEIPGSFAERWNDGDWWAGEAGRSITLAATPTGQDGRPMAPEAFLDQVAGDLGTGALAHRDGPVVGRARLSVDPSSGVEVAVLDGYSAVVGSGAAIRVVIDDPADWEWALNTWRSLEPAAL
jgi:hypothetical protein